MTGQRLRRSTAEGKPSSKSLTSAYQPYNPTPGYLRHQRAHSKIPPHTLLPYGSWTLADGTEVLFDRYYAALWQRTPDGAVTRAEVNRWYEVDKHHWFYDDGTSPGRNKETRKKLQALLAEWGVSS